jgi:hypothetical protein
MHPILSEVSERARNEKSMGSLSCLVAHRHLVNRYRDDLDIVKGFIPLVRPDILNLVNNFVT